LLALIEQSGNDPYFGKKAAEAMKTIGSPEQTEAAYAALAARFPADSSVWFDLGDTRFAAGKDALALEAYRSAKNADDGDPDARRAVARTEEVLRLDPSPRGLSIRERAQRWDLILHRILEIDQACVPVQELADATALLKQHATSLESLDKKVDAVKTIWDRSSASCPADEVLAHIMAKFTR
jgi:hypothetical protein